MGKHSVMPSWQYELVETGGGQYRMRCDAAALMYRQAEANRTRWTPEQWAYWREIWSQSRIRQSV